MRKKYQIIELAILIFFLVRSSIILNIYDYMLKLTKIDTILSIVFGTILGIIPIIIYNLINNYKPELNIIERINNLFGKYLAPLINVILLISMTIISIYILNTISIYINYNILKDYPLIIISLIFLVAEIYLAKSGLKTLIRSSNILISIVLIMFILSLVLLLSSFDINELKPLYTSNNINLLKSSLLYALTTSAPIFLISLIRKNDINISKNYSKTIIISYIISSLVILVTFILTSGILGINLTRYYKYPYLFILNKISILGFIERIETIISITYLFDGFILLNLILQSIKEIIIKTFKIKDKKSNNIILYIITLIILLGINYITYIPNNLYLYTSIIISIAIPIVLLISITIKKYKSNNKKT